MIPGRNARALTVSDRLTWSPKIISLKPRALTVVPVELKTELRRVGESSCLGSWKRAGLCC
jgi:hypothetical protein